MAEENLRTKDRKKLIRQAFDEAHHDTERAETVLKGGHHYPLIGIHEGEVLVQARSYVHPRLNPRS